MAGRGAWRQSHHRRLPRFCSDAVPHRPCNAPTLPVATVPVGALEDAGGIEPACTDAPDGAPPPVGNAKTHSTPSHDDGVEHKWWLPSPPPPPPPPPWASSRRPRHHIRRRLRRATRCVGAFAAAPAQHARALRAIDPCCGHELARLRVRAQLLRSARASRRAAKGAGRSMVNGEMVGSSAVLAWNRPQRGGGRAHRAVAKKGRRTHGRTN